MDFNEYDESGYVESDDTLEIIAHTDNAILLNVDGEKLWVPRSQIHEDCDLKDGEKGDEGILIVKTWLVEKAGLL